MDSSKEFAKCIDEIENVIKNLSDKINNSQIDWRDGGMAQITSSISKIAAESKDVIDQAEICWKEIKNFEDYLED